MLSQQNGCVDLTEYLYVGYVKKNNPKGKQSTCMYDMWKRTIRCNNKIHICVLCLTEQSDRKTKNMYVCYVKRNNLLQQQNTCICVMFNRKTRWKTKYMYVCFVKQNNPIKKQNTCLCVIWNRTIHWKHKIHVCAFCLTEQSAATT